MRNYFVAIPILALASCQTFESFLEQPNEMSNRTLCIQNEIEMLNSKEREKLFAKEIRERRLNCSRYSADIKEAKRQQSIKLQQAGQQMQQYGKAKPLLDGGFVGSSKPNPPKITRSTNSRGQGTIIQPSSGNNQSNYKLIKSMMSPGKNIKVCTYKDEASNKTKEKMISPQSTCPQTSN